MERDWRPQIITGTSVGSLNGAMFALDLIRDRPGYVAVHPQPDVVELPGEEAGLSDLHQFLHEVCGTAAWDVTPLREL